MTPSKAAKLSRIAVESTSDVARMESTHARAAELHAQAAAAARLVGDEWAASTHEAAARSHEEQV